MLIRRALLPMRLSHTDQCQNAYPRTLPGCGVSFLWNQGQMALMYVNHDGGSTCCYPPSFVDTLLPEHAVWIGLYQSALACFSASDYTSTPETLCYAQSKMHTVHIFCMSAQILTFLFFLRSLRSVQICLSFSPLRFFELHRHRWVEMMTAAKTS